MACTTVQMPQDAILGLARPRTMSRMYGSAAAAVSALLRTVIAAFTVPPSRCRLHGAAFTVPPSRCRLHGAAFTGPR